MKYDKDEALRIYKETHPAALSKKCNMESCTNSAHVRGVCASHYTVCLGLIKMKKTTAAELEAKGIYDAPKKKATQSGQMDEILEKLGINL